MISMHIMIDHYDQGHSKLFTTGQVKLNSEHYVIKDVGGKHFDGAHMAFLHLVICCYKSTEPKNHSSTLSVTYFCIIEYLMCIKLNQCVGG